MGAVKLWGICDLGTLSHGSYGTPTEGRREESVSQDEANSQLERQVRLEGQHVEESLLMGVGAKV